MIFRAVSSTEDKNGALVIIQANNVQDQSKLIACAQYICKEAREEFKEKNISVIFVLQVTNKAKQLKLLNSFSVWECCHIDELCESSLPCFYTTYHRKALSEIFSTCNAKLECAQLITGCVPMAIKHLRRTKKISASGISNLIGIIIQLLKADPKGDLFCVYF